MFDPFDMSHNYIDDFRSDWNRRVKSAKWWMIIVGIVLIVAGVVCAGAPLSLYGLIQSVVAIVLVVHGALQIMSYVQTSEFFRNGAQLASGILNALMGVLLIALPSYLTASTIGFLLGFLLIMSGIERWGFARSMRFYQTGSSTFGRVTGILQIVLGVIFLLMPIFSSLVISFLLAGYLLIGGIALIAEGIAIKKI